jgi:tyrosinase
LTSSNTNPSDPNWLKGPAASGEREFIMPMPGKKSWRYSPKDVNSLSQMNYTYENLKQVPVVDLLALRLNRLGIVAPKRRVAAESVRNVVELVGANDGIVPIKGSGASTTVQLDTEVRQKVAHNFAMAVETSAPDRVYLNLENVRGTLDATVLSIFINLPEGSNSADHPELLAGTVSLFGLRRASRADGKHIGGGLSFLLDISPIVDRMYLDKALNTDNFRVTIIPSLSLSDNAQITVGRVSIYREAIEQ